MHSENITQQLKYSELRVDVSEKSVRSDYSLIRSEVPLAPRNFKGEHPAKFFPSDELSLSKNDLKILASNSFKIPVLKNKICIIFN